MIRVLHTESSNGWGGQEIRMLTESNSLNATGKFECACLVSDKGQIQMRNPFNTVSLMPGPIGSKTIKGMFFVIRTLKAVNPDVVVTHSSTDSWLVAIARLFSRRVFPIVRVRHVSAPIRKNFLTKWLYSAATKIVTTSNAIKEHIAARLDIDDRNIFAVPTGVDTSYFSPVKHEVKMKLRRNRAISDSTFVFGMVSTLRSWKGHSYAIRALKRLEDLDCLLIIVGDGPQFENLKIEVDALGISERVIFRGYISDVREDLYTFDAFLQPSYANEGVSQSLLQAMASGLPVIVSDIGGLNEVVVEQSNGLICPPQDDEHLAQYMRALVDQTFDRKCLGKAARQDVEKNHSLESMRLQMERLLESVTVE
jgi:glycosyltransferase involved in cell wall biosynthesis